MRGRLASGTSRIDPDSIFARQLAAVRPKSAGTLGALGSRTIEVSPGKRARIDAIANKAFVDHTKFRSALSTVKKSALFGGVTDTTEVYEFDRSYIVVRSTSVTVVDPAAVRSKSPLFRKMVKKRTTKVVPSKLNAESQRGLADFKKSLGKKPKNHPLRLAAAKGDLALLEAMADGVGQIEIVDTLQLPKRPPTLRDGKVLAPTIVRGRPDYSKPSDKVFDTLGKPAHHGLAVIPEAAEKLVKTIAERSVGSLSGGTIHSKAEFVAGDTWGDSFFWERTFNVPSGFFRASVGASYAVGLRIPVEVSTRFGPTWVCQNGTDYERGRRSTNLEIKARAIDADAGFYRRAGMSAELVADGDEFVLRAGIGYGYKLRLFWRTLVNEPYKERGVDWGRDFDPPQGTATEHVGSFFIPAEVTHTKISAGPLSGSAQLGFRLDLQGTVEARVTAEQEGRALDVLEAPRTSRPVTAGSRSAPHQLSIPTQGWNRYEFRLRPHIRPLDKQVKSYQDEFGYEVSQVGYDSRWSVVPGLKIRARASYAGYGIDESWEFWLDDASLPIGDLQLTTHPDTRTELKSDSGRKVWHRGPPSHANWCVENNPLL